MNKNLFRIGNDLLHGQSVARLHRSNIWPNICFLKRGAQNYEKGTYQRNSHSSQQLAFLRSKSKLNFAPYEIRQNHMKVETQNLLQITV